MLEHIPVSPEIVIKKSSIPFAVFPIITNSVFFASSPAGLVTDTNKKKIKPD
jgi:hypothetical protein